MESKWTLLYIVFVILLSLATTDKPNKPETYKGMTTPDEMEKHLEIQITQMEMKLDTLETETKQLKKKYRAYVRNQ